MPSRERSRRRFLKATGAMGTVGFTGLAGCTGGSGGGGGGAGGGGNNSSGSGGEAEQEITIATSYKIGDTKWYPLVQRSVKENIETETDGRISVTLAPGGQLGVGTEIVKKVQNGTVEMGQHSISNMTPYASAVEALNFPYLAGGYSFKETNQRFVNLVTSDTWAEEVEQNIIGDGGLRPLFYFLVDPRTIGVRKGQDPVFVPDDMGNLKHRSGPTDILLKTWRTIGSSPNTIAWGETPTALDEGAADSAYVAIQAWRVFGFDDIISHVSFINMVEDAQMYSINEQWFQSLSTDLQEAVMRAGQQSLKDNLDALMASRKNSVDRLREAGVTFHELSKSEQDEWTNQVGYENTELWRSEIEKFVGGMDRFERLAKAARESSDIEVPTHPTQAYEFGVREEGDPQNPQA